MAERERELEQLRQRLTDLASTCDALREQVALNERRYQALFDAMLAGFAVHEIICDEQGEPCDYRFLEVNPAFERLTGLAADDIVGRTVKEVLPEIEESWIQTYGRIALDGGTVRFENYAQQLDRHYEVVAYRPAPRQFACLFVDVTERHQTEERLRHAQKMEAIGTLAGGIAHDFNNLLTGILGAASLLELKIPKKHPAFSHVEVIEHAAQRAGVLTDQLLGFSRRATLQRQPVDMRDAVGQVVAILSRTVDKQIRIREQHRAKTTVVKGDGGQLEQVVMNLAVNAVEAMPDGGELRLELAHAELDESYCQCHPEATPGRYLLLSVTDTGPGIPRELQSRVFEPFFTTKQQGQGTGMGLAMAFGIVKSHGGVIQLYSEEGSGSTMKVYLPYAERTPSPSARPPALVKASKQATVLVVDDEQAVRAVVDAMLDELGYQVLSAADGLQAIECFAERADEIDLVLLDITMPGMDGASCFRKLREIEPTLRVVVTSGHALGGAAGRLLDDGAVGFVQKPFTIAVLSDALARALSDEQS